MSDVLNSRLGEYTSTGQCYEREYAITIPSMVLGEHYTKCSAFHCTIIIISQTFLPHLIIIILKKHKKTTTQKYKTIEK